MNDFCLYFQMGMEHITDLNGLDHILFITALCLRYLPQDWKKIILLVTAFTVGHSLTLALSTFNIISLPQQYTEFCIALTIIITALSNCFIKDYSFPSRYPVIYFFALFFGLIHGMGFSSMLKSILGKEENILPQLFSFNIGLESGQLIIVSAVMIIIFIFVKLLRFNRQSFLLFVSGGIAAIALQMAIERYPFTNKHVDEKTAFLPANNIMYCCIKCSGHS